MRTYQINRSNAYEQTDADLVSLISYNTRVLEWCPESGDLVVGPYFSCSPTTRRHVGLFLKRHGIPFSYSQIRAWSDERDATPWNVTFSNEPRFAYGKAFDPFYNRRVDLAS